MRGYFKTGILSLLLFLTACGNSKVEEAKKAIEARLIDPNSVQYRNIIVKKHKSELTPETWVTVCGEVNAKNRMGGYVGFEPFIYNRAGTESLDIGNISTSEIEYSCN